MPHEKKKKMTQHATPAHAGNAHSRHSPFFILWEFLTLACVVFLGLTFLDHTFFHWVKNVALEERWVVAAEIILIAEVALLLLVARNKINFVKRNWPTIFAVIPFGSGFRVIHALKVIIHAAEKTKIGHLLRHPIAETRRWVRKNIGLPR
ncbi:MAG: hypothetical protein V1776_00620 [Candidatus Diapherotrites archaeon]